jgi:hypothetical protein
MHIGLYVECHIFLSTFKESWILNIILFKLHDINLYKNNFTGFGVAPCGETDVRRVRQADMVMLTGAFFKTFIANAPKLHMSNL